MRRIVAAAVALTVLISLPLLAGEEKLGKPVDLKNSTTVKELLSHPEEYVGKEVRVDGEITEVCQNAGCWIDLRDASTNDTIRVKVNDGEIVFPKEGKGRKVSAQGKFERLELTREQYISQLEHEAEESGKKADVSKVKDKNFVYRVKGQGAVLK